MLIVFIYQKQSRNRSVFVGVSDGFGKQLGAGQYFYFVTMFFQWNCICGYNFGYFELLMFS